MLCCVIIFVKVKHFFFLDFFFSSFTGSLIKIEIIIQADSNINCTKIFVVM